MTQEQAQTMASQIGRIEERVSSDRRNHAIQFKSLNSILEKLMNKMDKHLADDEGDRIRMAILVEHLEQLKENTTHNVEVYQEQREVLKEDIKDNSNQLSAYKEKMKYWEMFMNLSKIPFYTFMVWQIIHFREELTVLWDMFAIKFGGIKPIK